MQHFFISGVHSANRLTIQSIKFLLCADFWGGFSLVHLIDAGDKEGLNDNRVTVQLGLSVGSIGKSRKEGRDLSKKAVAKILAYYNDLDETWLLTGNGEMLCEPRVKEEEQKPIQEDKKSSTRSTIEKLVDGICSTEAIIDKLVDEISKSHDLVAKQQEQMDRVLTMLEAEKMDKGELEKILRKKYESSLK